MPKRQCLERASSGSTSRSRNSTGKASSNNSKQPAAPAVTVLEASEQHVAMISQCVHLTATLLYRLKKAGSTPKLLTILCMLWTALESIAARPAGRIALLLWRRFAQAEGASKPSGRASCLLHDHDCRVAAVDMMQNANAGWKACSRRP